MAEYSSVNGTAEASISSVNGTAKASIGSINNTNTPAESDAYWVAALQEGNVAWAANTALSGNASWTEYDNTTGTGHPRAYDIGYGKNASGNGIYVLTRDSSSRELQVSGEDVSVTNEWTVIDLSPSGDHFVVRWGEDSGATAQGVWMCGSTTTPKIFRSTDGAGSFSQVSPSGLLHNIVGMASNGSGTWAFGNYDRFYVSTDDGATFAFSTPWSSGGEPGQHRGIVYTNSAWVVIYSRSSQIYARACAASDITDWGDEFQPTIEYNDATADGSGTPNTTRNPKNPTAGTQRASCEGVAGNICMATTADKGVFTFSVSGKVLTETNSGGKWFDSDNVYEGVPGWQDANTTEDLTTDGTTWILSCKNGDAYRSTDNGASWEIIVNGFSVDDWNGIAAPVIFPL